MDAEKYAKWKPLSLDDLKAFLGFNLLMGLNSLHSVEDYWKRSEVYHYSLIAERIVTPLAPVKFEVTEPLSFNSLPRDRFREISRYLHFVDNSNLSAPDSPTYDRPWKSKPTCGTSLI